MAINNDNAYNKMWEDFAYAKSASYLTYKFVPTHRVGLTNYLREDAIVNLLIPSSQDVVLDAGCASGRQLFRIFDKIKTGWGTDISQNFINQANQHKGKLGAYNLHFSQANVEQLPFEKSFFDKIICAEVLEHVADKQVALSELLRILKPGGFLIITVPNLNADATWWGRLLRLLKIRNFVPLKSFDMAEVNRHKDAHVREFDKVAMVGWLESNNLEVNYIGSVSFIDGPAVNLAMKFLLHFSFTRRLIIKIEKWLSSRSWLYGRHLAVKATKKINK